MMHLVCTREHGMLLQTSKSKIKEETGRQRRGGEGRGETREEDTGATRICERVPSLLLLFPFSAGK